MAKKKVTCIANETINLDGKVKKQGDRIVITAEQFTKWSQGDRPVVLPLKETKEPTPELKGGDSGDKGEDTATPPAPPSDDPAQAKE